MKKLLLIFLFFIFIQLPGNSAGDPLRYTVKLDNFADTVFSERTSRFRLTSEHRKFSLIKTSCQRILKEHSSSTSKTIVIETGELLSPERKEGPGSRYLADTRFLNINSEKIKKTADMFNNAPDQVGSIEKFVYSHITEKRSGIPILPALKILKNRSGDCTEHTILALALLRSLGIHSRAVVGMILTESFNNINNVFVYHMWIEAYHRGKWRLVDATRPGRIYKNRYIAFTYHNMKTETPLAYLKAVTAIQNLSVGYIGRGKR